MTDSARAVTVLVVDDHPRFLEVARAVIEATPGFTWAGGASSGAEALVAAAREKPDLMLIDVNMPKMNGFQLARELGDSHPDTLVALISAQHPDELPQAGEPTSRLSVLTKENLRPVWLRELWREHRGAPPSGR